MNDNIEKPTGDAKDPLADLLKRGKPRQPAPQAARERAFEQLHAHWSRRVQRKQQRRRVMTWAVAASAFLAVAIVFNTANNGGFTAGASVAAIARSSGSDVYLRINRWSQPTLVSSIDGLSANSTLITGAASRLALAWKNGGSLRINEQTEVDIVSPERVRLVAGSIYFDSILNHNTAAAAKSLAIETPYGVIQHLGTQFSTRMQDDVLTISVREGEVTIVSTNDDLLLTAGDEFDIDQAGLRAQRHVDPFDKQWQWAEDIAPAFDSNKRSAYELLAWIGRETGHTVHYDTDAIVTLARHGTLTGMEGLTPMHALKALPYATDLRYDIVGAVINISAIKPPLKDRQTAPEER